MNYLVVEPGGRDNEASLTPNSPIVIALIYRACEVLASLWELDWYELLSCWARRAKQRGATDGVRGSEHAHRLCYHLWACEVLAIDWRLERYKLLNNSWTCTL